MTDQRPAHAKNRPPSAAERWLSCPESAYVVPMYPNDESDASLKGEVAHLMLENAILFGITPDSEDPDTDLNVRGVVEWVGEQRKGYGPDCQVYAEKQYDIPQTGEWGTCDITFVNPKVLHIADYKNGWVPVEVKMNAQMMVYLLGAIAEFGERKTYRVTVLQPNYIHRDGPYRTWEVSQDDLNWFIEEVKYSVNAERGKFEAGKHCKKSYCPHRGACKTFLDWAENNASLAWFPSEVNALTDEELSRALDHAEILQGLRDELRKEAMRRIANMDRNIEGYKMVKGRANRAFHGDEARDKVFEACRELGATDKDLYSQTPESVAGVERFFKQKFKNFGRGKWKQAYDNVVDPYVNDFTGGLTLERATDGRPAHTRGSEFGSIDTPQTSQSEQVTKII